MALQVWLPLIDTNIDNQGILHLSGSINGSVSTRSDGILGPSVLIGSSSTDAGSRIKYTPDLDLAEVLGSKQTIMAWVKPDGDHSNYAGTIVSSGNWNITTGSWMFGLNKTNTQVSVFSRGYNRLVNCVVPTGSWTHLACTRDGNTGVVSLYKNGEFVTSSKQPTGSLTSTNDFFSVGLAAYAAWCPFNGLIQDVRIYDDILSAREVKEISKGLIVHIPYNDTPLTSNKLYDTSGYGYHGACTNASRPVIATDSPRRTRCVKFDTTSKYVQITNLPALGDNYTFAWWGWWPNNNSNVMFWGYTNGNRYNMYKSSNKLYNNTGDGTQNPFYTTGTTVAPAVGLGVWRHYAITGDGTSNKLYVNGSLYATAKTFKAVTGTTITMPGWDTSTSYKNAGTEIADFRIYSTALSAEDIMELAKNPISVCKSGTLMCQEVVE